MDPAPLFFLLGALARWARTDLKLPPALYDALSSFLLLTIGLKGGVELARSSTPGLVGDSVAVVGLGVLLTLIAFGVLRLLRFARADAASVAAHYGSVSAVTFAVGTAYLGDRGIAYEPHFPLFLALLEAPAIVVGILLARTASAAPAAGSPRLGALLREALLGRGVLLLAGGIVIGYVAGPKGLVSVEPFFFGLFKGALCIFLLEMGYVAAGHARDLRSSGWRLLLFAIGLPLFAALLGAALGVWLGFSPGGVFLMIVLAASASYIAAPAAMRLAVPEANPALGIAGSLGVTFPFNVLVGLPLYQRLAESLVR
jgi:uncharacterized protein